MKANSRSTKQKLAAALALVLVIAGGAVAAVTATGADRPSRSDRARHPVAGVRYHDLSAAAGYLGISQSVVERELRAGHSLAQIADATPGRSAAGLTAALIAQKRQRLAAQLARLPQRVAAELRRSGGPAGSRGGRHSGEIHAGVHQGRHQRPVHRAVIDRRHRLAVAAAAYLGMSTHELRAQLRAGKTLAEIAGATPGKSVARLIDALVAARRYGIAARLSAGRLTSARAERASQRAEKVIAALVNRPLTRHRR